MALREVIRSAVGGDLDELYTRLEHLEQRLSTPACAYHAHRAKAPHVGAFVVLGLVRSGRGELSVTTFPARRTP